MTEYLVTFSKVLERSFVVEADEDDVAINKAWEKLRIGDGTSSETDSDWSVKESKISNPVLMTDEDHDFIALDMSHPALTYVLNRMCGDNYSPATRHSDLAWAVREHVRKGTVSMLAIRATAVQMDLHREAALNKLSVDERLALGVGV